MKRLITSIIAILFFSAAVNSQTIYKLSADNSEVSVKGTSSLHDWEMPAEEFEGSATVIIEDSNLVSIDKIDFSVDVASIKSGKSMMDKKTKEAFDHKKNPEIVFDLSEITQITDTEIHAKGILKMAGASNPITLVGSYSISGSGALTIEGTKTIKMSDYKMKPPTALMGTIKTGDEVEVAFKVVYQKNQTI